MKKSGQIALSFLVVILCTGAVAFPDPGPLPGDETGGMIALPLDENNNITLANLLQFASATLGYPILHSTAEVETCEIEFTTPITMPRSEFQGFFERVLIQKGYLYIESGEGGSAVHRVFARHSSRNQQPAWTAKFVPLEELEAYANRGLLITVCFPLEHILARETFQSLSSMIQSGGMSFESLRALDNGNAIIITTYGSKACKIATLLKAMDCEPVTELYIRGRPNVNLAQRVDLLEKRLAKLEAQVKQ